MNAGIAFLPAPEDAPIFAETCAVLGFVPWRTITEVELLEVSVVRYPANPHATIVKDLLSGDIA